MSVTSCQSETSSTIIPASFFQENFTFFSDSGLHLNSDSKITVKKIKLSDSRESATKVRTIKLTGRVCGRVKAHFGLFGIFVHHFVVILGVIPGNMVK